MIGRVRFVSRAEVKDFSSAAVIAAAAPEYLAALEPADEYELVGRWHIEPFAVHFFFFKHDGLVDTVRDGMCRVDHPKALPFLCFTPFEIA